MGDAATDLRPRSSERIVTAKDAREILMRYRTFHPIPPREGDSVRLGAFIANAEELIAAASALFDPAYLESYPHELPSTNGPFARFMSALQRFEVRR